MCGQKVVGRMTERTQRGDKGYNTGYLYRHQRSHLQLIKAHTYMVKVASLISLSVTKIHYQFVRRGRTGLSFTPSNDRKSSSSSTVDGSVSTTFNHSWSRRLSWSS